MNLIVAVDSEWGIGCGGELLAHIPGDLKYFKETTMDKVVVMGRKTLESLPGKKGLPKRVNFVLTGNPEFEAERCQVVHSKEELTEALEEYKTEDVFILGGESIYRRFYEQCDKLYVTKMHANLNADRFMVNLDEDARFRVTWESELQNENGIEYQHVLYERS